MNESSKREVIKPDTRIKLTLFINSGHRAEDFSKLMYKVVVRRARHFLPFMS